jgi:hypothetical protein
MPPKSSIKKDAPGPGKRKSPSDRSVPEDEEEQKEEEALKKKEEDLMKQHPVPVPKWDTEDVPKLKEKKSKE